MPDQPLNVLNDCTLAFDTGEQKFLFISPNTPAVLGYNAVDFYQNPGLLFEIIDLHQRASVWERVAKLAEDESVELYYQVITAAGHVKWVYDKKSIVAGRSGNKILLSVIKDRAPDYHEGNRIKKKAAEKMDIFIESITDSFFIIDKGWRFVKINTAFEKVTNRNRDDIIGQIIWDIFPGILTTGFEAAYRKAAADNVRIQFTEHFEPLNMWFNTNVYPSAEGLTVFIKDITEERRAQEELTRTKNSLEALINNTEDQIWSIDKESRYVYMNKAYRRKIADLTGLEPKEGYYSYLHPGYGAEVIEQWKAYYNRALSGEVYNIISESFDPTTQQLLSFEISFNPIINHKGEITGIGCFARNITKRLETEKAIVGQNERLRHIASLTSHELRRPVASMLGLINVMDRVNFYHPDNKEIIEHLFTVGKEIDEVLRLIVDQTYMDNKYQSP